MAREKKALNRLALDSVLSVQIYINKGNSKNDRIFSFEYTISLKQIYSQSTQSANQRSAIVYCTEVLSSPIRLTPKQLCIGLQHKTILYTLIWE